MIEYEYMDMLKQDSVPKDLIITDGTVTVSGTTYTVLGQTVLITNNELELERFSLTQQISDSQLTFGTCNAARCEFTLHDNISTLRDKVIKVYMYLDHDASTMLQIGVFRVYEDTLESDKTKRKIVAYDALYEILNADVTAWYATQFPSASSTKTIAQLRASFLQYFNIPVVTTTLVNDSQSVKGGITGQIFGSDVIRAICEFNGVFGTITNEGKFKFLELVPGIDDGLFPSDTLYPSETLYPQDVPSEVTNISKTEYYSSHFEDYLAEAITQLTIRPDGTNSGVTVGTAGNTYTISNNFLMYGLNQSQLTTVANNILEKIKKRYYKPCAIGCIGNPCHEVGDPVRINTVYRGVTTYILQRRLTGIQALKDEYTANGVKVYDLNPNSITSQIKRANGKITSLEINTDSIEGRVEDIETGDASVIQQLSNQISAKVSSTGGSASTFGWSLTNSGFQLQSNGDVVFDCDAQGVEVDGSVISRGSYGVCRILDGQVEVIPNETLWSTYAHVQCVQGGEPSFSANSQTGSVVLSPGGLAFVKGSARTLLDATSGSINGNTIITTANIGSQSVNYASSSYSADYSNRLMDVNNSFGTRPSTWSSQACVIPYRDSGSDGDVNLGWSSRRWKDIYATNGTIQTSDARQKKNIAELTEAHSRFIKAIVPRSFQFVAGESGRTHIGFVAQEIESAMTKCGLTDLDFAGFIKSPVVKVDAEGNPTDEIIDYIYGLRYEEFIALLVYGWQHTEARLDSLIERLENKGII